MALTRIVTGDAHLPATTALGSLARDYRTAGLRAGANVLMPDFTPHPYRGRYDIYPGRLRPEEPSGGGIGGVERVARAAGRFIDYSRGDSRKEGKRHA
jgi:biotin synthase